jgi:hypothetical protein
MISRKSWTKALAKLEKLPLTTAVVAMTISATGLMAYAQESAPPAPASAAASLPFLDSVNVAQPTAPAAPAAATAQAAPSAPSAPAAPTAQAATPAAAPVPAEPFELNFDQANKATKNSLYLEVAHEDLNDPSSPIRAVTLRGKMYKECAAHFNIVNSNQDLNIAIRESGNRFAFGFKIIDDGHGLECVTAQKMKPCTASTCVSLSSQFEGATMDTINFSLDGDIQLIHTDLEHDRVEGQNIGKPLKFESSETINQRAIARENEERQRKIEENEDSFKNCRHSLEELAVASKALNALIRDTDMAIGDAKSKRAELAKVREALEKKQVQADFNNLRKRIAKAKDAEELDSLSDDIANFASDHPEFAKDAKIAQAEVINAAADTLGNTKESFDLRRKVYDNLIGMEGVSAAESKSYRMKKNGLDYLQLAEAMKSGDFSGWNAPNYESLRQKAQSDLNKANCQMTMANAMADACQQARNNAEAVSQLPAVARAAQSQLIAQLASYQSQFMGNQATPMQGFNNGAPNGFMNGNNGFMNTNAFAGNNGYMPNNGYNPNMNMMGTNTMGANPAMSPAMSMMGGTRGF